MDRHLGWTKLGDKMVVWVSTLASAGLAKGAAWSLVRGIRRSHPCSFCSHIGTCFNHTIGVKRYLTRYKHWVSSLWILKIVYNRSILCMISDKTILASIVSIPQCIEIPARHIGPRAVSQPLWLVGSYAQCPSSLSRALEIEMGRIH